eukprot:TRINITY_DN17788_c0_g1_i1.p1 TRINITY_DN17788_c0_g1~~TRINITY_DN17788_c0_g1_i1.p1  ORF type:complete len:573 (+),score=90.63 TRINITY_DN17788_c0_g1_i1:45-1763(+)
MPSVAVLWSLLGVSCLTAFASRVQQRELDTEGLLQSHDERRLERLAFTAECSRISIVDGKLMKGSAEVLPLGANYNVKGPPYYPPPEVVAGDAKYFADGVVSMKYKPSDGRLVVPVVRLSAYLEGAMPSEPGVFDPAWQSRLEATVQTFADAGVYVFLDIHQDALSTSTGGEGLPVWMLQYMQENEPQGCGDWCQGMWYTVTPERPLELVSLAKAEGLSLKCVQNCTGDSVPANAWLAYSAEGNAGNPQRMNVGNMNMKANTFNMSWNGGLMVLTEQVNNVAWRFYRAYQYESDKRHIFDPYMSLVRYLVSVWERYPNVVAIDLLNEPPFGGFTHPDRWPSTRTDLYGMYAQVLSELDADAEPTKAILVFEDVGAQISLVGDWLAKRLSPASSFATEKLTNWSKKGQLMYEFHWYPGQGKGDHSLESLKSSLREAVDIAKSFGNPPFYLGEFQIFSPQAAEPLTLAAMTAYWLAQAGEIVYEYGGATYGIKAATYWEYANSTFTGNAGWCKTPEGVTLELFEGISRGYVDLDKWKKFEKTVADGTSWGACITGFYPAIGPWAGNVLAEVPAV